MRELIATKSTEDGRRHGFLEQKSPGLIQPLVHTVVCRDLSRMKIKMLCAHFWIVNYIPSCSCLLEVFSSLLEKGIVDWCLEWGSRADLLQTCSRLRHFGYQLGLDGLSLEKWISWHPFPIEPLGHCVLLKKKKRRFKSFWKICDPVSELELFIVLGFRMGWRTH
jgi:hypothetical protein